MKKTTLFTLLTLPFVALMAFFVYDSVASEIKMQNEIKESEAKVIAQLKLIREAQKAYESQKGEYTDNWDSLKNFIKNGVIYRVNKREIVIPADKIRTTADYHLGDSIRYEYDTLGSDPAMEIIYPKDKFSKVDVENLEKIPGQEGKVFKIQAIHIKEASGAMVNLIEVVDPYPVDKTRSESHPSAKRRFLRFGSMEEVSIAGNWE
ncbi:hypothetical protein [Hugenholtzia roseola]|uniref:hypothetical protein n=1 Tax=Hugenholtzia roseola TaxID=1002 RepID=UPI00040D65CA|nr:hypothetical protein [Hugenholtzia roseola]